MRAFLAALLVVAALTGGCKKTAAPVNPYAGADAGSNITWNVREAPDLPEDACAGGTGTSRCFCSGDYFQFVKRAARFRHQTVIDPASNPRPRNQRPFLGHHALRGEIINALGLGFLTDGLAGRPLQYRILNVQRDAGVVRVRLLFDDPFIGSFDAVLLGPDDIDTHPGIIALHGHSTSATEFLDSIHAREFIGRGFVLLAPSFEVMCANTEEDRVTRHLLENGFSLVGVRVYQTLLMAKYLRHLSIIESTEIGVIGHSGGAVVGNLAIRVDRSFGALVSDCDSDFAGRFEGGLTDDYVPELRGAANAINDFSTSTVPVLKTEYGFKDTHDMVEVIDFFTDKLAP